MNYTVVFVEDEQIVREEIVASVRWELLGLTLVGTAADGMEGERSRRLSEYRHHRHPPAGKSGLECWAGAVNHAIILTGHTLSI